MAGRYALRTIVDLYAGEQVLVPESARGTLLVERVPATLAVRLTHVETTTVVGFKREAGDALGQVVTQMTVF